MSLVGAGGGAGPDLSTLAGSRSEARSLAEVTITLKAALEGATMDSIRALIAQLTAPGSPSSLLRAVVATVRAELEALLLVATPTPSAATSTTTPSTTSLPRLQTILSSLLNTPTLPLEECAGEFLALSVTLAVHTPHHPPQPSSSSSSSSSSASTAPPTPADVAFREAAAMCAAGYVGRFGRVWPEVEVQAVGLLLDAAVEASLSPGESGSGSGSGSGSSAGPVVTLQSPAALFGALSTLVILPSIPSQHRPLVGKLAGLLEGYWEGGGSSSSSSSSSGSGSGRGAWEEETKRVLSRVRKAHGI